RKASGPIIPVIEILAVQDVPGEAVARRLGAGETRHHLVLDDRDVDRALYLLVRVIARLGLDVALEAIRRLHRLEQDRATGRIPAEKRALRPFQDLHVLEIEIAAGAAAVAGGVWNLGEI